MNRVEMAAWVVGLAVSSTIAAGIGGVIACLPLAGSGLPPTDDASSFPSVPSLTDSGAVPAPVELTAPTDRSTAGRLASSLFWATEPEIEQEGIVADPTIYATSIPWIHSEQDCRHSDRQWQNGQCWDQTHDPNF